MSGEEKQFEFDGWLKDNELTQTTNHCNVWRGLAFDLNSRLQTSLSINLKSYSSKKFKFCMQRIYTITHLIPILSLFYHKNMSLSIPLK